MHDMILESLDDSYDIERSESKYPFIYDQWDFKVNGVTHIVRFMKADPKKVGQRATIITFGIRKGLQIRRKIDGVGNIRKYLATVLKAIESSIEDPTTKMKNKMDGLILVIPTEIFEKVGTRFVRIAKMRLLKDKFRVNDKIHDADVGVDDSRVMLITKSGKSISTAFPHLNIDDEVEADPVISVVDDIVSSKPIVRDEKPKEIEPRPIVEPPKYVENQPVVGSTAPIAAASRQNRITGKADMSGDDLRVKYTEEELKHGALMIRIYGSFFADRGYGANKEHSLNEDSITNDQKELMMAAIAYVDDHKVEFLPDIQYIAAFNLSQIKTDYIYDTYEKYSYGEVEKVFDLNGLDYDVEMIKSRPYKKDVDFSVIVDIAKNTREILGRHGLYKENMKSKYGSALRPLGQGLITSALSERLGVDGVTMVKNILTSNPEVYDIDPYKFDESSKKTKMVKTTKYKYDSSAADALESFANDVIYNPEKYFSSAEDYIKFNNALPVYAQSPLISPDPEMFRVSFFQGWLMSGGSRAQAVATVAANKIGANANLPSYFSDYADKYLSQIDKDAIELNRGVIEDNFQSIYNATQQYFKEKLKKKYSGYKFKLFRGIGSDNVETYIPGALESWTTALGTAKTFAKMMSHNGPGTVMYAEVPVEDIWASWDATSDVWVGEEDLKGKKEYVVLGGTFASTPLNVFNTTSKETGKMLKTFKEWTSLNESEKTVKIVTPNDENFDKIVNDPSTAKGNDEKERQIRKSDTVEEK